MKVYNSLTRKKEEFTPLKKSEIGIYVCGPTVYDEPHIGHARSAYIFDVIRRYFEYRNYHLIFARNVTDVDDKIINKAREVIHGQGSSLDRARDRRVKGQEKGIENLTKEISKKYLDAYHEDMRALGIKDPDKEPKATEYIPKMIKFIEALISNGSAYEREGDVYFDIRKAKNYGKLSNQNLDKMELGARVMPGEKKRDGLDFALWKKAKEDEPSWDSPWGRGRPGWHIECSVMSSDILGREFDIHGGGIDLIFPHHENEIAQSEGLGEKFARYWIHNGLLTINNEKMAKSLGNFVTIKDFLAKHKDPDYLKLLFLSAHYRGPVDYTEEKIEEAKKEKERFLIALEKIEKIERAASDEPAAPVTSSSAPLKARCSSMAYNQKPTAESGDVSSFRMNFEEAMDDDFNTPMALASLFDLVTRVNKAMHGKDKFSPDEITSLSSAKKVLLELSGVLGLDLSNKVSGKLLDEGAIIKLVKDRDDARKNKDFKKADEIRKKLSDAGVIIEDTKEGALWRAKP